jgi:hypothetical protein
MIIKLTDKQIKECQNLIAQKTVPSLQLQKIDLQIELLAERALRCEGITDLEAQISLNTIKWEIEVCETKENGVTNGP